MLEFICVIGVIITVIMTILQYVLFFTHIVPDWDSGSDDLLPRKKIWFWIMLTPVLPIVYILFKYLRNVYKQLN